MRLIAVKCPQCGAEIEITEERQFCFCRYCGTKIIIDDEIQRSEHKHIIIDEARIREVELNERIKTKEFELREKQINETAKGKKHFLIAILLWIVVVVVSYGLSTALLMRGNTTLGAVIYLTTQFVFFIGGIILIIWGIVRRKH